MYKEEPLSVSSTAKEVKVSKGLVSAYFHILTKENLLKRVGRKFYLQQNRMTKALKILLALNGIETDMFRHYPFVKGVGIYGSVARGTNTKDSDIDMWIRIEKTKEENLAKLTKMLTQFGNVRPLYLTKEKKDLLKKEDQLFYHALLFGSITIYGDEFET